MLTRVTVSPVGRRHASSCQHLLRPAARLAFAVLASILLSLAAAQWLVEDLPFLACLSSDPVLPGLTLNSRAEQCTVCYTAQNDTWILEFELRVAARSNVPWQVEAFSGAGQPLGKLLSHGQDGDVALAYHDTSCATTLRSIRVVMASTAAVNNLAMFPIQPIQFRVRLGSCTARDPTPDPSVQQGAFNSNRSSASEDVGSDSPGAGAPARVDDGGGAKTVVVPLSIAAGVLITVIVASAFLRRWARRAPCFRTDSSNNSSSSSRTKHAWVAHLSHMRSVYVHQPPANRAGSRLGMHRPAPIPEEAEEEEDEQQLSRKQTAPGKRPRHPTTAASALQHCLGSAASGKAASRAVLFSPSTNVPKRAAMERWRVRTLVSATPCVPLRADSGPLAAVATRTCPGRAEGPFSTCSSNTAQACGSNTSHVSQRSASAPPAFFEVHVAMLPSTDTVTLRAALKAHHSWISSLRMVDCKPSDQVNIDGSSPAALGAQWGHTEASTQRGSTRFTKSLLTALDIALALNELHSHNILHTSLNPGHVLLIKDDTDPRGFRGRLDGLELAVQLPEGAACITCIRQGNPVYQAPEVRSHGKVLKSSDVFSLGMMLWEMVAGRCLQDELIAQAYAQEIKHPCGHGATAGAQGRRTQPACSPRSHQHATLSSARNSQADRLHRSLRSKVWTPVFPADTPPALAQLVRDCLSGNPYTRPTVQQVISQLTGLLAAE